MEGRRGAGEAFIGLSAVAASSYVAYLHKAILVLQTLRSFKLLPSMWCFLYTALRYTAGTAGK